MKSYSLWGVLGTGCFTALALAACSVTTNNINTTPEGGGGDDGAATDGGGSSSGGSSSGASSSGGSSSGGSSSGGVAEGGGEGGEGGTCQAALTVGSTACDTCMKANCCTELTTCDTPGDAGVNDAGLTVCEQNLDCVVRDAANADASLNVGLSDCFSGDASAAPADLTALLSCASAHCATDCQ